MSKGIRKIDGKQFTSSKEEIVTAMSKCPSARGTIENEFEMSAVVAAGIKRAIKQSGLSRAQVVDKINDYFGRSKAGAHADDPTCRNPLTIHRFNNYLSKPHSNPIPAYYLFPIHHITRDLEPIRVIAEPEGAQIATSEDIRHIILGKLEDHMVELRKMKKQLKDRR